MTVVMIMPDQVCHVCWPELVALFIFFGGSMLKISSNFGWLCVAGTLVLAACAHKQEAVYTAPPTHMATSTPTRVVTNSIVPGSAQDFRVNVGDTVHFGYNQYSIEESDKTVLQRQASWLNKYPSVRVTVEGHCDERGTREYNLALGARRANSVKEYLSGQGVALSRIDTISYGKERPICTDSNEACWAQNRRGLTAITSGAATS
jgi:peptidoglycan-associated lipoprotein